MKRYVWIFALVVLVATTIAVSTTSTERQSILDDGLDPAVHAALKKPLGEKIAKLREKKNEDGVSYIYGSYYDSFTSDGDDYKTTFITRTSSPDELVTERSTLTLTKDDKNWVISDEKLEQRVDGIFYRSVPRDETFHKYDSFAFEREGLKISGGAGDLVVDYIRGEPFRLGIRAENPQYSYMTPVELGWYGDVLKRQLEKFPKDIVFPIEYYTIQCTPAECKEFISTMFQGLRDATLGELMSETRKSYEEFMGDLEDARKEYPLAGFRPLDREGVKTWIITMKKQGRDHFASLSYDNEARHEMKFRVSSLGERKFYGFPIFVYNSEETRNSGIDPYELERRDDIQTTANGRFTLDYDVIGLTGAVELAVKDPEMMSCDFTYELMAKRDLDWVPFYVAQAPRQPGEDKPAKTPTLNVFVMEDGDGNPLTYIRQGRTSGAIVFPETMPEGSTFKVHVKFDNGNSIYKHNHSYSRVNRGGWAPFVSFTDNIEYFDLKIAVDPKYQILGIDHKVSEDVKGGLRVAHYKSDFPLTFPTIIFGDYESDTSKIQAKKLDGTPIPVAVHVDKTSMKTFSRTSGLSGDGRVNNKAQTIAEQYRDKIQESQAERNIGVRDIRRDALGPIADQAVNAINLYQEIYGIDYPFAKMDLVSDPLGSFYGQAPPSIVYLGFGVFYPTARVNVGGRGDISSFQNTVVAHELGHQWWGSAVVNSNFGNYWFVETLAEYSAALYSEAMAGYGVKDPKKAAEKRWAAYMKDVEEWRRVIHDRPDLFTSVQHSDSMMPGIEAGARTAAIYNKGPYAFHMLRLLFGEEKFFRFLKTLAQEFEGKAIVTRDIQNVAQTSLCGVDDQGNPCSFDLEWFFDQWIRGVGMPEYTFNYTSRQAEDGNWIVEGKIKQRVVMGSEKREMPGTVFRGKTSITVTDRDNNEYPVPVVINAEETPFAFKVPKQPLDVVLNKNGGMLAHDVLVNRDF